MATAKAISFKQFRETFSTEDRWREYLMEQRFPNGFVCPKCGCQAYYPIRKRHTCQCRNCRHQLSVTAGTIMHRTHLPLTVWFWAIYLCATDNGISAVQLAAQMDICYESAWYLLKRIRTTMGQRDADYILSGLIEMDDAYIGGIKHGGKRGRGTEQEKIVLAVSKTKHDCPLFLHIAHVDDLTHHTLQEFVNQHITAGSVVQCDDYASYKGLTGVECHASKYDPTSGDLKWLHTAISNLKSFLLGTYHGRCTDLQAYFDEFTFRFNRRAFKGQLFSRLARAVATSRAVLS